MLKSLLTAAGIACAALAGGLFPGTAAAQTVSLAVTDVEGLEQLQRDWRPLRDKLQAVTGYEIEFFPVSSRTAAVEALGAERLDFVLTGPAEYVVMNKLTGAYPIVGFGRPDYFSGVIVLASSGIAGVQDLRGRKIALGDIGSTSSHLAPSQLLADYGLDPRSDMEVIHTSEAIQWEALKRGDVDAVGMNYMSDFIALRDQETELPPGAFKVVARGPDLPNDVLMAGPHVDREIVEALRKAFVENSDDLVAAVIAPGGENTKYEGMAFVPEVTDSDYDYVRRAYAAIGHPQFGEFVGE
ncbi:phosphate/phosphite/phosphonate ABC transporter substrate-binding protein [Algihabitans albus]|uniref:phosphate/phosphite/phosphonate ABC transporter substrate-binding protein n=1 Tax=Algihabitans albus TaxID=2164067 RepID=UPI000E5D61EA|nr:phosphate/phosphite/phosphonate ABC transporter substrate-binding protein [Algihabitans albus]